MRYFRDIGLLILYSLLALFFIDADSIFICALLCTAVHRHPPVLLLHLRKSCDSSFTVSDLRAGSPGSA